jgi:hypothetical protein
VGSTRRRNTILYEGGHGQTGEFDARVDWASGDAISWSTIAST